MCEKVFPLLYLGWLGSVVVVVVVVVGASSFTEAARRNANDDAVVDNILRCVLADAGDDDDDCGCGDGMDEVLVVVASNVTMSCIMSLCEGVPFYLFLFCSFAVSIAIP